MDLAHHQPVHRGVRVLQVLEVMQEDKVYRVRRAVVRHLELLYLHLA